MTLTAREIESRSSNDRIRLNVKSFGCLQPEGLDQSFLVFRICPDNRLRTLGIAERHDFTPIDENN